MIFINNKYTKWYFNIINRAKNKTPCDYSEKHHIIPKSLGGDNSKENLVYLTAKEHFICHCLLPKMLTGDDKTKMVYAAWHMANQENQYQTRYKMTSSTYHQLRKSFAIKHSLWMKENHHTIREKVDAYWTPENRKIHAEKISKVVKGRKVSEATKEKHRNKIWTDKALENLKNISIISANNRRGCHWSEKMRNSQMDNYIRSNMNTAILVFEMKDGGITNISTISKTIGISWDRIKLILDRRHLFDNYHNNK